jgi:hypothetical protein
MVRTILTGGGYNSTQVKHSTAPKVEPKARAGNVAGVAQQGAATAFQKEPLIQGKGYEPSAMAPTGAPGKYNANREGPGSQRTVYKSGSQSQYGSSAASAVNRAPDPPATRPGGDILSGYGPEMKRGR